MKYEFLEDIASQMREKMENDIIDGDNSSCFTYDTNDGYIEICTNHNDDVAVSVIHDSDDEKESPRLEKAIENIVPSWDDVAGNIEETDEFSEHGFSDEADYLRYRYG